MKLLEYFEEKLLEWILRKRLARLISCVVWAAKSAVQDKDAYVRGLEISGRLAAKNPDDNRAFRKRVKGGQWIIYVRAVTFDQHDVVRVNFTGPWLEWAARVIRRRLERRQDFQFIVENE